MGGGGGHGPALRHAALVHTLLCLMCLTALFDVPLYPAYVLACCTRLHDLFSQLPFCQRDGESAPRARILSKSSGVLVPSAERTLERRMIFPILLTPMREYRPFRGFPICARTHHSFRPVLVHSFRSVLVHSFRSVPVHSFRSVLVPSIAHHSLAVPLSPSPVTLLLSVFFGRSWDKR